MSQNIFLQGNLTALLLMHPYTESSQIFGDLACQLNREGYTVYAPTFSGHSATKEYDKLLGYEMSDWLDDT